MKKIINYTLITSYFIGMFLFIVGISILFTACNDNVEIQQVYSFELETMPVQKRIVQGETAEIRCSIIRNGYYEETDFYIRYFQPDGKGELRLEDGTVLLPNDLYPLQKEVFRLYYTSHCTDQQQIDVYIESNFGQVVLKSFSFQNENDKNEAIIE